MKLDRKDYQALCKEQEPSSPSRRTVPAAFAVGGALCLLGQVLRTLFENMGLDEKAAGTAVSISLIFLGVALTACRLFDGFILSQESALCKQKEDFLLFFLFYIMILSQRIHMRPI